MLIGTQPFVTISGSTVSVDEAHIADFHRRFEGEIIGPNNDGYDETRAIWNAMIDKRPALIARCTSSEDVVTAVNFARNHQLLVSVRGSGHNVAGNAVCEGGLMIDMSLMKDISVDPDKCTATAQAGVVFGELDQATQPYGLAAPSGIVSETGIAGLTLGGGFGWLTRKHGFTCDNLLSAEVVTASGQLLTASDNEHQDLFWAIRGGGGNFGVVTSFTYKLHPLGPEVLAGLILYPIEDAKDALRFFREYTAATPNELGALAVFRTAPPAPFIPEARHGQPVLAIIVIYIGDIDEGEEVIRPLREFGTPIVDAIKPKSFIAHNTSLDPGQPSGMHYYWKSEYVSSIADEAIEVICDAAANMTSPYARLGVFQLGGAIRNLDEAAMAVSHRDAEYVLAINTGWADAADTEAQMKWTSDLWVAIQPFSSGVYVNFLSEDDGDDRVHYAYGPEKYKALVALKTKYDPQNLFSMNNNIKPSSAREY